MESARISQVQLNVTIQASIADTWNSLINDIGTWWKSDFYTSQKTQAFILEAKPGGKMYEDYGNNEGLVWGEIVVIDSPSVLELKSNLSPAFGGPSFSYLRIQLDERDSCTTLSISDIGVGALSEGGIKQLEEGWTMIFGDAFKSHVEVNYGK